MGSKLPYMNWDHTPLADSLRAFKARIELYFLDNDINDDAKKAVKIRLAVGDNGMRRLLSSGLTPEQQGKCSDLWNFFEVEVDASLKINFRVHGLEFATMHQNTDETINAYVSRLREKASKCEFDNAERDERLIEMIILSTPYEDFRKELLTKKKGHRITLVIERGREYEAIKASVTSLTGIQSNANHVHAVQHSERSTCHNCGLWHQPRKCPAYFDTCEACGNKGHWQKHCRKSASSRPTQQKSTYTSAEKKQHRRRKHKKQHAVQKDESSSDDEFEHQFCALTISDLALKPAKSKEAFAVLTITHQNPDVSGPIRLKIDTGSGGNTLHLRTYKQMFGNLPTEKVLRPEPKVKLTSYSGHPIPCRGSLMVQLSKPKGHEQSHKFYIVDVPGPAILGLPSCTKLDVISLDSTSISCDTGTHGTHQFHLVKKKSIPDDVKYNSIQDVKWWHPNCFDTVGEFSGEAKLHLKPNSTPYIDPPRRTPVHILPKIKEQLEKMVADGIIKKIDHHTDWCSSVTYVSKKDGTIRICLDPQKLNLALKRCPHKIPTVEEINPELSKAKFFSKLDAKAGYWSVKLADDSTELTTFRTPVGRYCYLRLPFGLAVSQDIFQQHMDRILEQCDGVRGISDDIIVYGRTEEEHDLRLKKFLTVAKKEGLKLNSAKCVIKSKHISFFGRKYTSDGLLPDPKKIEDINQMPTPQDKQDLQRFLGMVNFISPHLPHLSQITAPLRDLLKKTSIWQWEEDHQSIFEQTKKLVSANTCLQYYDPSSDVQLEVDASIKGLGATLVQNGHPVAFASKSLTSAEANYSNIERECLAIIHGIQRFHHYLYGRAFNIISDHKPLEVILHKPLHRAPPRIQRMMTKIQGYNFTIKYVPGPQLVIADTLSRMPNPKSNVDVSIDEHVNEITLNECQDTSIDLLNFSPSKQSEIKVQTSADPVLSTLAQLIYGGWPDNIKDVPTDVREYWSYRDELTIQDGIILKGHQIVIPPSLRFNILQQLHISHQGIDKTKRFARENVFWPCINKAIDNICASCHLCQEMQPQQTPQPLQSHERPLAPWVKLGTDLFHINDENFMIISDYYSRYPVVRKLYSLSAKAIIKATKEVFALFGCPREIVSDNGPQYQREYDEFCEDWNVCHTTSSPKYPKSNGFIERQIKYIKPIMKKCIRSHGDIHKAMLSVRATPIDSVLSSPGELMFGRRVTTPIPCYHHLSVSAEIRDHFNQLSDKQKIHHDAKCKQLAPLMLNQPVRVFDTEKKLWSLGKVVAKENECSYRIATDAGRIVIRNRVHLRPLVLPEYKAATSAHTTEQSTPSDLLTKQPPVFPVKDTNGHQSPRRSGRATRQPLRYGQE